MVSKCRKSLGEIQYTTYTRRRDDRTESLQFVVRQLISVIRMVVQMIFGQERLYCSAGIPTLAEILEIFLASRKFNTKKTPKPAAVWDILRKFRINLLGYDDSTQQLNMPLKLLIVDVMHGPVHYKDRTYWRFNSKWYVVSSDRLAIIQDKFRQLLVTNLMSDLAPTYLSKKFPLSSTPVASTSSTPQSSSSTNPDSESTDTTSQQSTRD